MNHTVRSRLGSQVLHQHAEPLLVEAPLATPPPTPQGCLRVYTTCNEQHRRAAPFVDQPSGQCRAYNVSPGLCRKRRPGADGPAPPGTCAVSLRCMSSAGSAASSLLLPGGLCLGPLLPVEVLGAAARWAASTSVGRQGRRRGREGRGRLWEVGPWASAPALRSDLQGSHLHRRSSGAGSASGTHHGLGSRLTDLPMVALAWASVGD